MSPISVNSVLSINYLNLPATAMRPPLDLEDELITQAEALVEQVSLDYFTAEPTAIPPFGSSQLRWKVDGPEGFRLQLGPLIVEKTGTKMVQPKFSRIYRLHASDVAGYADKFLGSVTINVDLARCVPVRNPLVWGIIYEGLRQSISENPDLYFRVVPVRNESGFISYERSEPEIIMTTGQIRFILKLGAAVSYWFDATVDIDVSFGLDVIPDSDSGLRRVVPVNTKVNVDASVSWFTWFLPGSIFWVPSRIDNAEDNGTQTLTDAVSLMVDEIIGWMPVPDGMEPHSVRIEPGPGRSNKGIVEVTFCPLASNLT